ncbi:hypothetical protein Bca52824_035972 [Brassica carinata]|uniref:Replication protein A 70 kDa DNA-binding subunit B/D first OB fold domain-containing protein n=1 Tax=Brassica carinata TaxID=52824 RepID=A0A8X7S693_BRACI|nr:hypothetical protein Bca52824_035972 [Brassica carinata]
MSMVSFVPLTKLRPFKDNWRVQVKCLHSWKQNTPFAGDTFEMVLADQWQNLTLLLIYFDVVNRYTLYHPSREKFTHLLGTHRHKTYGTVNQICRRKGTFYGKQKSHRNITVSVSFPGNKI